MLTRTTNFVEHGHVVVLVLSPGSRLRMLAELLLADVTRQWSHVFFATFACMALAQLLAILGRHQDLLTSSRINFLILSHVRATRERRLLVMLHVL